MVVGVKREWRTRAGDSCGSLAAVSRIRRAWLEEAFVLLETGSCCWRVAMANRAAVLIDTQAYYDAAMEAMTKARRSIHFLNWAFEPDTRLRPRPGQARRRTGRHSPLSEGAHRGRTRSRYPHPMLAVGPAGGGDPEVLSDRRSRGVRRQPRAASCSTAKLPMGACHHQKVIVVDDAVAFCGGARHRAGSVGHARATWTTIRAGERARRGR